VLFFEVLREDISSEVLQEKKLKNKNRYTKIKYII
jgi:hypothetical protein